MRKSVWIIYVKIIVFSKSCMAIKLLAVIKADAYGHGAVRCAHALADIADGFAVATVDEGVELRQNGIKKSDCFVGRRI